MLVSHTDSSNGHAPDTPESLAYEVQATQLWLSENYEPRYSAERLPPSGEEAARREMELRAVHWYVQEFLRDFHERGQSAGLSKKATEDLRRPLTLAYDRGPVKESNFLKGFLRREGYMLDATDHLLDMVLQAIARNGFQPNELQSEVLRYMCPRRERECPV